MLQVVLKMLGAEVLRRAAANGLFDWRLGVQLLRDKRVPARAKWGAIGLGIVALVALEIAELPLQTALWVFLPFLGFAADAALDGIELLAVPFFVAALSLPFLAPRELVDSIRFERGRQTTDEHGRVYEAAQAKVR